MGAPKKTFEQWCDDACERHRLKVSSQDLQVALTSADEAEEGAKVSVLVSLVDHLDKETAMELYRVYRNWKKSDETKTFSLTGTTVGVELAETQRILAEAQKWLDEEARLEDALAKCRKKLEIYRPVLTVTKTMRDIVKRIKENPES